MTSSSSDPRRDCAQIARELARVAFPWDTTRSLELALFRTFASPRIGGLLHATGEFEARSQKRYDDTDLIVRQIVEHDYESDRGRRAIARMNAIHGRFKIANNDFLYVLSTFVLEPIRWNARFGWRTMTEHERMAWFWFWREVGERMGIAGIPESLDELDRYNVAYERDAFRFTDANHRVAVATREMFARWFPAPLRPLVRRSIHALLDPPLLVAFGLEPASPWLQRTTAAALRARGRVLSWLPKRRRAQLRTEIPRAAYPNGYRIESLGPPPPSDGDRRT